MRPLGMDLILLISLFVLLFLDSYNCGEPKRLLKKRFKKVVGGGGLSSRTGFEGGIRRKMKRRRKIVSSTSPSSSLEISSPSSHPYPNASLTLDPSSPSNRSPNDPRFLSLFTIVSFKNEECGSKSGNNNGTCYSKSDCTKMGGTGSGTCAHGFGVCCIFTKSCGYSTKNNGTYFQNVGYPSTFDSVGSCQLTVHKCNDNVCQLRLDFENFVLAQPEPIDHQCQDDQFIVSGGPPIPAICGTNSGAHMYVDMGMSSNSPITLTVVTSGKSFSRSFSIKVTQIECSSMSKASNGCLQYFTGVAGQFFSFNYNSGSGLQLSNTDYAICIRMERNFCGIQYTACKDNTNSVSMSFSITGGAPADGSLVGTSCDKDWITIPCATNSNSVTSQSGTPSVCVDRICGMVFNSVRTPSGNPSVPVNSFSKPFNVFVHTDGSEGTSSPSDSSNRGFCLNFIQQPCTSSLG
ncbi:uncharacterized protein [Lepeophtheirus salmonis]|uniref:uncharacterized protein isoform X2 n=2 Tax=Lepeophtheirus salmonis TaxID=72036 RepID=UPI001AE1EFFB|nr:uncharacterized protein LOC121125796 isoform X2 [Lepeophtheirus salmonis]